MTIDDLIADLEDLRKNMAKCGVDTKTTKVVFIDEAPIQDRYGIPREVRYSTLHKRVEIKTGGGE